ncbi:MAG: hypothetical protein NTV32_04790 [Gammaproteobacteria bacterium]|nr:hypothetical protein [Gammaproteobacteria bacterium]
MYQAENQVLRVISVRFHYKN